MHTETTVESESKLVKHALATSMREHRVKQEILAQVLGIDQSNISRLTNPNEYSDLEVGQLSVMHKDPFTAPVAADILEAIGAGFHADAPADGDLMDEFIELTSIDGKFASIIKDGVQKHEHKKLLQVAQRCEEIAKRIRSEVKRAKGN